MCCEYPNLQHDTFKQETRPDEGKKFDGRPRIREKHNCTFTH